MCLRKTWTSSPQQWRSTDDSNPGCMQSSPPGICVCIYVRMYVCVCMYVRMCMYVYVCMCMCMWRNTGHSHPGCMQSSRTCMQRMTYGAEGVVWSTLSTHRITALLYAMYVCVCVYIYTHTHTHTYMRRMTYGAEGVVWSALSARRITALLYARDICGRHKQFRRIIKPVCMCVYMYVCVFRGARMYTRDICGRHKQFWRIIKPVCMYICMYVGARTNVLVIMYV